MNPLGRHHSDSSGSARPVFSFQLARQIVSDQLVLKHFALDPFPKKFLQFCVYLQARFGHLPERLGRFRDVFFSLPVWLLFLHVFFASLPAFQF